MPQRHANDGQRKKSKNAGKHKADPHARSVRLSTGGGRGTLKSDTAAAAAADSAIADEFDARGIEGFDELHQGIDIAADHALACFHALNRGNRQACQLGKLLLIQSRQGSGSAKLRSTYHV